jgi:hypothetical protein
MARHGSDGYEAAGFIPAALFLFRAAFGGRLARDRAGAHNSPLYFLRARLILPARYDFDAPRIQSPSRHARAVSTQPSQLGKCRPLFGDGFESGEE